jgi:hypothetical protein
MVWGRAGAQTGNHNERSASSEKRRRWREDTVYGRKNTLSETKRLKNKWWDGESRLTLREVFGSMSAPIEGSYPVVTSERIRFAGLACMIGGGLEVVFGSIYFLEGFTLFPVTEFLWLFAQLGLMGGLLGMLWLRVTGSGRGGRLVLVVPLIGVLLHLAAFSYFIASGSPTDQVNELLTPIGAQFVALGMILVGITALRAKVWRGWRALAPLLVGLYFYLVPFVGLILMGTGRPPYTFVGLWGVTWILLGYAVSSSASEQRRTGRRT